MASLQSIFLGGPRRDARIRRAFFLCRREDFSSARLRFNASRSSLRFFFSARRFILRYWSFLDSLSIRFAALESTSWEFEVKFRRLLRSW